MKRLFVYCAMVSLTLPLALQNVPALAAKQLDKQKLATMPASNPEITSQISSIGKAVTDGNVDSLVNLWAKDGTYTDDTGTRVEGREALKKHFSSLLASREKPSIVLKTDVTKMLSPTVSIAEGTVLRKDANGKDVPDTHFSIVLTKEAGKWLIASATESDVAAADQSEMESDISLNDLAWLIGDWKAERNGNTLKMRASWAGNKNFIKCSYEISKDGQPLQDDTEVIGINPLTHELVSWSFDSSGAYGQSTWRKEGKQWQIDSAKTTREGSSLTAHNIISPNSNDGFTWQSVNRTAAGLPLSDTAELPIQRASN